MLRVRESGGRVRNPTITNFQNSNHRVRNPTVTYFQTNHSFCRHFRPPARVWSGHRGFSRLSWRRGPRELPLSSGISVVGDLTTLFVDFIPHNCSTGDLKRIFEQAGCVADVYISKKARYGNKMAFGFVRFKSRKEAVRAIENLNGMSVKHSNIKVSMAKYDKSGHAFKRRPLLWHHPPTIGKIIKNHASRGSRNYVTKFSDTGRFKEVVKEKKRTAHTIDLVTKSIPVFGGCTCQAIIKPPDSEVGSEKSDKSQGDDSSKSTQTSKPPKVWVVDRKEGDVYVDETDMSKMRTNDVAGEKNDDSSPKEVATSIKRTGMVVLEDTNGSHKQDGIMKNGQAINSSLDASKLSVKASSNKGDYKTKKYVGKLKKTQNFADIATFLGYYSNTTEVSTQNI
ncbi:unnamed protein product [Amaranthus hypochondriacus]